MVLFFLVLLLRLVIVRQRGSICPKGAHNARPKLLQAMFMTAVVAAEAGAT